MPRCPAAALSFRLLLIYATLAARGEAQAQSATIPKPDAPAESSAVSLDRIRAGLERPTCLACTGPEAATPTFRIEVRQEVIELRDRWSDRDPDKTPDRFTYPIPSAAELLVDSFVLKPRAALAARKRRAIQKQIHEEIRQIEQQREATAPRDPDR